MKKEKGDIKTYCNKQKLKEFITSSPALPDMLKGVPQTEMILDSNSKPHEEIKNAIKATPQAV